MKTVKAVAPFVHKDGNFKTYAYEAWEKVGGQSAQAHYPLRAFHRLAYRHSLPALPKCFCERDEAHLRFVQALSITFDTWPDTMRHEIIPFVWDCWPVYFEKFAAWLKAHHVRTAIFTSSQTAECIKERFPDMQILTVAEGINTALYDGGKQLAERCIPLYEIGSVGRSWYKKRFPEDYKRLHHLPTEIDLHTDEGFHQALQETQISVMFPKCYTLPEEAGDIETLTQRFWEGMLSRMVIVGHAPKELIDLLGYNPVIQLDREHPTEQIEDILAHIEDYQPFVDRNREAALANADWTLRMQQVMDFLKENGYKI